MAYSTTEKPKKNKEEDAVKPNQARQKVSQAQVEAFRSEKKKRDDGDFNDSELELNQTEEMELATNYHNNCAASNEITLPLLAKISNNEL